MLFKQFKFLFSFIRDYIKRYGNVNEKINKFMKRLISLGEFIYVCFTYECFNYETLFF